MAWMYTKYKMKVYKQADFTVPLHVETWIEKMDKLRIWQDMKIFAGDELYAAGRLESCVFHLKEQKLGRLSDIEMPGEIVLNETVDVDRFAKIRCDMQEMDYVYSHIVRYSDLDKSSHMSNLRYVNLMENAFSPDFYRKQRIKEFELHYMVQIFYGEEVRVYKKKTDEGYLILGEKENETVVFMGIVL